MPSKIEKIVLDIQDKLKNGEWYSGMKLPTQSELAGYYKVNRSTIVEALARLKAKGILTAKQGQGTFVGERSSDEEKGVVWSELTNWSFYPRNKKMVHLLNEWENDEHLIQLSKGVLAPELVPVGRLQSALARLSMGELNQSYGDGKGDFNLRQELSRHLQAKGVHTSPEGILVVSGALNGLQLICTGILQSGSTLYHEPISYLHTLNFFEALGMKTNALDVYSKEVKMLPKGMAHSLYINATFSNPTTRTLTDADRHEFLRLAARAQTPIIEDDIYSDLYFHKPVRPIKSFDRDGQVLYLGSFSKTISPSLRLGWLVGPSEIIGKLADLRMQTDYGSSILSQSMCAELLKTGEYEDHLIDLRKALSQRKKYMCELLDRHLIDFGDYKDSTGGFFIWFTFKKELGLSGRELVMECRKKGVVINPGFIYGESGAVSARLSFAYATYLQMSEGIEVVKEVVEQLRKE
ncbi:PLP-dependent aminotransferase family protein [Shouchella patagoniensis]|uniref:aminotransferase-like domain-containing protein n=1 Tax=Shouchella patagoniensis TaxID=228576 RepID=UPI001474B72F|nr:PLP-dependent aminotransferase family protein [Shouchella patagoniensis]